MEHNSETKSKEYRTLNLNEAAYLLTCGHPLRRIDPPEPSSSPLAFAVFEATPSLFADIVAFTGNGTVSARDFAGTLADVRRRMRRFVEGGIVR